MSSHFGNIESVELGTYASFKVISEDASSTKVIYCDHDNHCSMTTTYEGLTFLYVLQKVEPPSLDQIDFDTNIEPNALKID